MLGPDVDLWDHVTSQQEPSDARRRGWTPEREQTLKDLWAQGYTGDQIATELGGVTRNAVIGKIHRLGLSGRVVTRPQREPTIRKRVRVNPNKIKRARAEALAEVLAAPPVQAPASDPVPAVWPTGCSLHDLTEDTCRWPFGDPREADFHFCGRQTVGVLPYCGAHARMAYQPAGPRKTKRPWHV